MKHKAFFIFMTALLIGSPLYAQKYKIALIHSYQEGYSGAGIVNKLFVKGLKDQQIDFQLRTFLSGLREIRIRRRRATDFRVCRFHPLMGRRFDCRAR